MNGDVGVSYSYTQRWMDIFPSMAVCIGYDCDLSRHNLGLIAY
ncbi:uncharacterized protein METZ01_LOCUS161310 [marine metagenome]|uniref:Uncharacterized protein n=1 Tax=marine metagenome TaxID=408172 RepID=A0A382B3R9_9ZZZZ